MLHATESADRHYYCKCNNVILAKEQIMQHLSEGLLHSIQKISSSTLSSENFKKSMLKRIEKIAKVQKEIQKSSNQIIQKIIKNTSNIISKLYQLIKVCRDLILNPPKESQNELSKYEIVSTFKASQLLYNTLFNHFQQNSVAEKSTFDFLKKSVKNQVINLFKNYSKVLLCAAVFNDEKSVVTGGTDGAIRIWNLETKSQVWFMLKHKSGISSLCLGVENELMLSDSSDTTVRLWNLNLKKQLYKFEGHTDPVRSVLISQDNKKGISASLDKTIRIWNLKAFTPQHTIKLKTAIYQICLINEEKTIVATQTHGTLSFFSIKTQKTLNTKPHHDSKIACICFSQDEKRLFTGSLDGSLEVWRSENFQRIFYQQAHTSQINCIRAFNNTFATASEDSDVIIWDLIKLSQIKLIHYRSAISSLYFFKNSNSLLICCAFEINICSLKTFKNEEKIRKKPLNTICLSADLRYVVYGFRNVYLFDLENNNEVSKSSYIDRNIMCLIFSENKCFVAAGCFGGEIWILDIPNLVKLQRLCSNLSRIFAVSFSQNNKFLGISDAKSSVIIILIETKKTIFKEEGDVRSLVFCSNDQKFMYTEGRSIHVLNKNFSKVSVINFSDFVHNIIANEKNNYVLATYTGHKWSIIRLIDLKKKFECKKRDIVKQWCARRKDLKFLTHMSLFGTFD